MDIFKNNELEELLKEIGTKFKKTRLEIEEIYLGNSSCYYPYSKGKWITKDNNYKYRTIYYIDDTGFIYKSIIEKINNKRASEIDNCLVDVIVFGLLLEDN